MGPHVPSIFSLMARNASREPGTIRFPSDAHPAEQYRGPVRIDTSKCIACGICDYVCPSSAITVTRAQDRMTWEYDLSRCTFCGRCVLDCPGQALRQDCECPAVCGSAGAAADRQNVMFPACTECGRPTQPFNDAMILRAYGNLTDKLRDRARLCDRCRLLATQSIAKRKLTHEHQAQGSEDDT